jgi:hypothetical protein
LASTIPNDFAQEPNSVKKNPLEEAGFFVVVFDFMW